MADKAIGFLSSMDYLIGDIDSGSEKDWNNLHKALGDFGDVLQTVVRESKRSKTAEEKAAKALFKIKDSLAYVLDETRMVRFSRKRCLDIFESLEETAKFEHQPIEDFLSENELSNYEPLFSTCEEILYAGELLELDITDIRKYFEPFMEKEHFSRLRKIVLERKGPLKYIEREMESELKNMEKLFSDSSGKIRHTLLTFIDDLTSVLDELVQATTDLEHKRKIKIGGGALAVALGCLVLGGVGIACLLTGIPGLVLGGTALVTGGVATGAIGGHKVYKADKAMQQELTKLRVTHDTVTKWQENLRGQFLHWRSLMTAFKGLFYEIRQNRQAYQEGKTHLEERFLRTKILIWETMTQTASFESDIELLRDKISKCSRRY